MSMINVEINGVRGQMDESLLVQKDGGFENEIEKTVWREFYLDDVLVHRSVHVTLKEGVGAEGVANLG